MRPLLPIFGVFLFFIPAFSLQFSSQLKCQNSNVFIYKNSDVEETRTISISIPSTCPSTHRFRRNAELARRVDAFLQWLLRIYRAAKLYVEKNKLKSLEGALKVTTNGFRKLEQHNYNLTSLIRGRRTLKMEHPTLFSSLLNVIPDNDLELIELMSIEKIRCEKGNLSIDITVPDVEKMIVEECEDYGKLVNENSIYIYHLLPPVLVETNEKIEWNLCDHSLVFPLCPPVAISTNNCIKTDLFSCELKRISMEEDNGISRPVRNGVLNIFNTETNSTIHRKNGRISHQTLKASRIYVTVLQSGEYVEYEDEKVYTQP